ncbi:MAG: hypothetical protein HY290_17340 [Planctomycetia bacterium]|nr:hypothetical protein [Planctomycetia bacterium]
MAGMKSFARLGSVALACLLAVSAGPACTEDQEAGDEVEVSGGGASWRWTPEEWTYTETHGDLKEEDYAPQPPEQVLKELNVEWQKPELDALGNRCTVRGQLSISAASKNQKLPVNWFQGVTLYMAMAPQTKPDWTKGMNQADTVHATAVAKKSGAIELHLDLRETLHDASVDQPYQVGLALAKHAPQGKSGQKVVWNSRTPAIPASVQMLTVPRAPAISRELELINRAAGWPFAHRKIIPSGVDLIRAVSALHALGKDRALATLEKYVELSRDLHYDSDQEIVFWIIRLLFEPIRPGDRIPAPMIALILDDREFAKDMKWPLNPMELVEGIPFMVGHRIAMGGMPEHPSSHIRWARRHGVLRETPPIPATNPIQAADSILASRRFQALPEFSREQGTQSLRMQALVMVRQLVSPMQEPDAHEIDDDDWKAYLDEAATHGIRWDPKREQFVVTAK